MSCWLLTRVSTGLVLLKVVERERLRHAADRHGDRDVERAAGGVLMDRVDRAVAPLDDVVERLDVSPPLDGERVERVVVAGVVVGHEDRGDAVRVEVVALQILAVRLRRERRADVGDDDRKRLLDVVDAGDAVWNRAALLKAPMSSSATRIVTVYVPLSA